MGTTVHSHVADNSTAKRYALAVLTAVVALLLRQVLAPWLGPHNPYHTVWAGVVFSAWYCGLGPSLVTTLISALGVWYWFLPPFGSFAVREVKAEVSGMAGFLTLSAFIIAMGEANRRSKAQSERAIAERHGIEDELRRAQTELESRVEKRTTELNAANESLRQLSARLLQLQDEERRRFARELHDSAGQLLTAVKLNIAAIRSIPLEPSAAKLLLDIDSLVDQLTSEIRTMSHLLHPPLLDDVGLSSALKWYVDGFSERSKIAVDIDIPEDIGRLGNHREIAIFRVVQESLTNVHRHSGSRTALVRLSQGDGRVRVEIRDAGKGIPLAKQPAFSSSGRLGVGFRGMRERIAQLGGNLEIQSDGNGTAVVASLPLETAASANGNENVA
jgi:signal transduction histidine kinase